MFVSIFSVGFASLVNISKSCIKIHLKVCKFFSVQHSCNLAVHCAYKHDATHDKSDTKELMLKIISLEASSEFPIAQKKGTYIKCRIM